jgi:hypothetical protein
MGFLWFAIDSCLHQSVQDSSGKDIWVKLDNQLRIWLVDLE